MNPTNATSLTVRRFGFAGLLLVATTLAAGELPPPPDPAVDGRLPRAYAGWELGQAAPTTDRVVSEGLFPDAKVHIEKLPESPRIFRRALVHDGTVFRIEWKIRDADLDRQAVIDAFAERLGPPIDSPYAIRDGAEWSDGTGRGRTTWLVRKAPNSEWLTVGVQDAGRALDLYNP